MFREVIEQENDFMEGFIKFVCGEEKDFGDQYLVCRNTGLQYLGEFFERFDREFINPIHIVSFKIRLGFFNCYSSCKLWKFGFRRSL